MAKASQTAKSKKEKGQSHGWKNFEPDCPLALELEKRVREFEDSTTTLRQKLARKYNVVYHRLYFTRNIPDLRRKDAKH